MEYRRLVLPEPGVAVSHRHNAARHDADRRVKCHVAEEMSPVDDL
jgi:hypothetical protein